MTEDIAQVELSISDVMPAHAFSGEDAKAIVGLIATEEAYRKHLDELLIAFYTGVIETSHLVDQIRKMGELVWEHVELLRNVPVDPENDCADEHAVHVGIG